VNSAEQLLMADVPLARQFLRRVIDGKIEFLLAERPEGRGYEVSWRLKLTEIATAGYISVASPRGFEPRLPP